MSTFFFTYLEVYGISSIQYRLSAVGTARLPFVRWANYMGKMKRKREKVMELEHEFDTQQLLAVLMIWASPDPYIISGKPSISFFSLTPWAFWLAAVRTEATIEPTILYHRDHSYSLTPAVGFNLKSFMKVVVLKT